MVKVTISLAADEVKFYNHLIAWSIFSQESTIYLLWLKELIYNIQWSLHPIDKKIFHRSLHSLKSNRSRWSWDLHFSVSFFLFFGVFGIKFYLKLLRWPRVTSQQVTSQLVTSQQSLVTKVNGPNAKSQLPLKTVSSDVRRIPACSNVVKASWSMVLPKPRLVSHISGLFPVCFHFSLTVPNGLWNRLKVRERWWRHFRIQQRTWFLRRMPRWRLPRNGKTRQTIWW